MSDSKDTGHDDWQSIVDAAVKFVDAEVVAIERDHREIVDNERYRYDESGRFSAEFLALRRTVRTKAAGAGFYTMFGDPDLGGGGAGLEQLTFTFEQVFRHCGPGRLLVEDVLFSSVLTNGLTPILKYMDPDLRNRHLPDIAAGEVTLALALTESEAGSDIWRMRTTAEPDGEDWVLNGSKQWITNAPYADFLMVFAITDKSEFAGGRGGISAFWVPAGTPGVGRDGVLPIMGHLGSDLGALTFENVRLPADHLIGQLGRGFDPAFAAINKGRISMAAKCLGIAEWALDRACEYAESRTTFGEAIGSHGQVEAMLAECAMDIYALKSMLLRVSQRLDDSDILGGAVKEVSIVKAYGTEACVRVFDRCIQVLGANGLSNEMRMEEGFRYARTMRIPDGTSEIQRRTIARRLLAGDREF
jgi:acyl-CoA dehydrogenase